MTINIGYLIIYLTTENHYNSKGDKEMKGTDKQVAWAQDIINACVEIVNRDLEEHKASLERAIAKGKKTTRIENMIQQIEALRNDILSADDIDAGKVINYGKEIAKAKDIPGAINWMTIDNTWKKIK